MGGAIVLPIYSKQKKTKNIMKKSMSGPGKKSVAKNPFVGPSSAAKKSAYSTAAQKRMKADAEGTYKPIATKTRVLPEMSGKLVKKAQSVAKKPSMKRGK